MTKADLMKKFDTLEKEKGVHIECIYWNSNKSTIENAINCLECDDSTLDDYLTVFKLAYPNSYKKIVNNGNWKKHSFNRLYVYNTARSILPK